MLFIKYSKESEKEGKERKKERRESEGQLSWVISLKESLCYVIGVEVIEKAHFLNLYRNRVDSLFFFFLSLFFQSIDDSIA